jgi:hypothetical protein
LQSNVKETKEVLDKMKPKFVEQAAAKDMMQPF